MGLVWGEQRLGMDLSGNLAEFDSRLVILDATVGGLTSVRLSWTQAESIPLILGRKNFFDEFDVCFYGSRRFVEVRPRPR